MNSKQGESLGLTLLLTLFVGLKLAHVINWSWLWVLSPVWIPFALFIVFFLGILIVAVVRTRRRRRQWWR